MKPFRHYPLTTTGTLFVVGVCLIVLAALIGAWDRGL